MKHTPLPMVSGRYFLPKAPVLCLKRMPDCAVTSVNSMGPAGREASAAVLVLPVVVAAAEGIGDGASGGPGTAGGAGTATFAGDGTSGGFGGGWLQLMVKHDAAISRQIERLRLSINKASPLFSRIRPVQRPWSAGAIRTRCR